MKHWKIKFVGGMKNNREKSDSDCSDEFDNYGERRKIKRVEKNKNKAEAKVKLGSFKIVFPKVKLPKALKFSKKEETLKDLVLNNKGHTNNENLCVSMDQPVINKQNYEKKNPKISQCAKCSLGDPSFACTCNYRNSSPDFKLYDDDVQFMHYNNAFFC